MHRGGAADVSGADHEDAGEIGHGTSLGRLTGAWDTRGRQGARHAGAMNTVTAALVGGPTVVLRYAGLTIVTDPTFDPPGKLDGLTKTEGPAIEAADLPPIDLALVSHDHHADNLAGGGLLAEEIRHACIVWAKVTEGQRPEERQPATGNRQQAEK